MPLRHWGGTPPPSLAGNKPWACPTCGKENSGRLEEGCVHCRAGKDAMVAPPASPVPTQALEVVTQTVLAAAFERWRATEIPYDHIADVAQLQKAFMAGALWASGPQPTVTVVEPVSTPTPTEEQWTMAFMAATTKELIDIDDRTQSTILAALAAYRDNYLAYGAVPGMLSAQECSALIAKLTPPEGEELK